MFNFTISKSGLKKRLLKVTRSPCKLPTDVQKVLFIIVLIYKSTYICLPLLRSKQFLGQSLMIMSMLSCSPSKVLEVLQVC